MDVVVKFDGRRWVISPDPVKVKVGTAIRWVFNGPNCPYPRLRWTVYFHHGTPFGPWQTVWTIDTNATNQDGAFSEKEGDHKGATASPSPSEPGEFKYSVKVENRDDHTILGDDDPKLIVWQ